MGLMFANDVPIWIIALLTFAILLIGSMIGMAFDNNDILLAGAICDERYGTEFLRFEYECKGFQLSCPIEEIICKQPITKKEKYDGLVVRVGGG